MTAHGEGKPARGLLRRARMADTLFGTNPMARMAASSRRPPRPLAHSAPRPQSDICERRKRLANKYSRSLHFSLKHTPRIDRSRLVPDGQPEAFQFLHVDIVARAVPKKATAKRWPLRDVLAEAGRETAACPHIEAPRPPKRLFGLALPEVERATLRQAEEARDAKGRKLRKDSPVMLAGVLSYPVALADMNERSRADYAVWETRSLRWLSGRYGDTLASVVRHEDESFPHLHYFIVPRLTSDRRLDLEAVHPGIAARPRSGTAAPRKPTGTIARR